MSITRRRFLVSSAAITVAFTLSLPSVGHAASKFDDVEGWIRVDDNNDVTVFCGKAELGTGVRTALAQMVAEELDVHFDRIQMVLADTALCPNQLPTVGSMSVNRAGPELRRAAAEARLTLLELASGKSGVAVDKLRTRDGAVITANDEAIPYGDLLKGQSFHRTIRKDVPLKNPKDFQIIGKPQARVEIPDKVFGSHPYVQNHVVEGMLHGRVCRSPLIGAKPAQVDDSALKGMPGNPRVYAKGGFVGVVADTEFAAIQAAAAVKVQWLGGQGLGKPEDIKHRLQTTVATDKVLVDTLTPDAFKAPGLKLVEAEYLHPFQMHASIGASCAMADVTADGATVWSPTQSSFLTRDSLATMLGMPPEKVRLTWMEGSGCYGQNGADDCTGDAALLSQLCGKPVRVQWMRHDEHGHEPKGAAMAMRVRASVSKDGQIQDWEFETWSPSHSARPFAAAGGNTLAGLELGLPKRYAVVGADFNLVPSYELAHKKLTLHLIQEPQLRVSALRGLGSVQNLFAIESLMDELAHSVGKDPIDFRLAHLTNERSKAVLQSVARLSKWKQVKAPKDGLLHGQGVGFCFYNNEGTYVAAVVDVVIDPKTGAVTVSRVSVAHDCGLVVNPDGVRNQIEGNTIQAMSRALMEQVVFDDAGVKSLDWTSYPILHFTQAPKEIAIDLINRPDQPALGIGEQTTCAVLPAVGNAIFAASGARVRETPFTPERVLAAMPHPA